MTSNSYKDLARINKKILLSEYNSDVIIYVDEGENSKEFFAHSTILIARSPYFETAFSNDNIEKAGDFYMFDFQTIPSNTFKIILRYLYTAEIVLDELSGVEFLHLRIAADKFLPEKVIENLQSFMDQKLEEFIQHDAVGMLQEVFKHNNSICNPLRDSCLGLICRHPNALFEHPNFTQLDETLLIIVLQQNDLGKLNEITILTYLVKWGMARILTATTQDITNLKKSDYIELQKIIRDCVPLIRWFQIPITELRKNLSWIEKLLPSTLYLDIVNYHFDNTVPGETVKFLPLRNVPPKDSQEIPKKSLKRRVSLYEDLAHDNERLLQSGKSYDVIIYAGEGDNSKEFHAHSLILSLQSPYFEAAFLDENTMKQGNIFVFTKQHIPASIFETILRYLYTSEIFPDKLNGVEILHLLVTADELQLQNLVDNFQSFMNQKLEEIMREDIISIFDMIFKHNNRIYESLRDHCLYYICMNPGLLFDDPKFIHLDRYLLKITLQRDDLGNISEDDIWNNLIKWGITQASDILQSKNINDWIESDYVAFKETIHEFIPLIHWFQISSTRFKQNLLFFEKILTNDLYNDVLHYHLNSIIPNRTFRTFPPRYAPSNHLVFVKSQCFNIIANWINLCTVEKTLETKRKRQSFMEKILHIHDKSSVKPEESKRESTIPQNYLNFDNYQSGIHNLDNDTYYFNLLYCAKRDGYEAEKFHKLCDKKGSTVTIVKIKGTDMIFGGYNHLSWEPYEPRDHITMAYYAKSDKNFLFCFENTDDLSRSILARVKKDSYAVEYSSLNGPIFGHSDYKEGYDIRL
ncbi:19921_t:CDS:2 [Cetraspora pellucida]|uniref:19921_t:CDS:1 n=1 Tax=Cetraspora pellucida TaxID=1433469 RepID=A0A9N9C0E4_9GLOM|nr:19921_t:CDS:2 [Cetraspora pellucida]